LALIVKRQAKTDKKLAETNKKLTKLQKDTTDEQAKAKKETDKLRITIVGLLGNIRLLQSKWDARTKTLHTLSQTGTC
jgi:hypothetical protein